MNIPTAEEFLSDNIDRTYFPFIDEAIEDKKGDASTILQCMREFAQLHVEAALQAAVENATASHVESWGHRTGEIEIDKDSILNAYPKENIK